MTYFDFSQFDLDSDFLQKISLEEELLLGRKSLNPRVALKFEVVYLWLILNNSQGKICKKLGLSRNTVKSYIRQFKNGGIDLLRMFYKKYHS